ncbi:MAG: Crp/Fnr family transcriptional regulator [Flavobacteriales bacterium]|nr:Crp/Fnr family transcriptional regulator [Flavobacteriales bacterium]
MTKINQKIPSCVDCKNENKVFCAMSQCERSDISVDKGANFYQKGQTIFYEGNYAHGLFCIYKGKVKLTKNSEDGKEQIVRFAQTGELLGYRSLLSEQSYQVSAIAIEDCSICHISKTRMIEVLEKNFQLSQNFMQLLMNDLQFVENRLISSSHKNVMERVAETLIVLYRTFGIAEGEKHLNVSLSRTEMAEMTGTTVESFIRTLTKLSKDGFIYARGKNITIKDINGLLQVARIFD